MVAVHLKYKKKCPGPIVINYILDSWVESISFFQAQTGSIVSHRDTGLQDWIVFACPCKLRAFLCMLLPLQLCQIPLACAPAYQSLCVRRHTVCVYMRVCMRVSVNVLMQHTAAWRNGQ